MGGHYRGTPSTKAITPFVEAWNETLNILYNPSDRHEELESRPGESGGGKSMRPMMGIVVHPCLSHSSDQSSEKVCSHLATPRDEVRETTGLIGVSGLSLHSV